MLLEPLYQPKQLQLDTFNLHGISATRGHIPAQFAHDNTVTVHRNKLQLWITHLL